MDWEPYDDNDSLDHGLIDLEETMDDPLEDSESSYFSDECSGSVEFVGNLEYSMANDDNMSDKGDNLAHDQSACIR